MNAVLVMFKPDGERREFPLTKPTIVVGRKHTCDMRIPLSSVSRQHCRIEVRDDGLYFRDLGSSNGTFYNGERLQEGQLNPGDQLSIGPVFFTVVIDGKPENIDQVKTIIPEKSDHDAPPPEETYVGGPGVMDTGIDFPSQGELVTPPPTPQPKHNQPIDDSAAAMEVLTGFNEDDDDDDDEDLSVLMEELADDDED